MNWNPPRTGPFVHTAPHRQPRPVVQTGQVVRAATVATRNEWNAEDRKWTRLGATQNGEFVAPVFTPFTAQEFQAVRETATGRHRAFWNQVSAEATEMCGW